MAFGVLCEAVLVRIARYTVGVFWRMACVLEFCADTETQSFDHHGRMITRTTLNTPRLSQTTPPPVHQEIYLIRRRITGSPPAAAAAAVCCPFRRKTYPGVGVEGIDEDDALDDAVVRDQAGQKAAPTPERSAAQNDSREGNNREGGTADRETNKGVRSGKLVGLGLIPLTVGGRNGTRPWSPSFRRMNSTRSAHGCAQILTRAVVAAAAHARGGVSACQAQRHVGRPFRPT